LPFAPPALIAAAVEALKGAHPLTVLVVPAMVRAGVPVVTDALHGRPYGASDEVAVLDEYFRLAGGPPAKPYRAVWEPDPSNYWRDRLYPGRSLQRMRTDRVKEGKAFLQAKGTGGRDLWGLRPTVGADLVSLSGSRQVRLADLAIWYGREQDVAGLDELIEWFLAEFPVDVADLTPTLYTRDRPQTYTAAENPFAAEVASQADFADAVGAAPIPPSYTGEISVLASRIEACVTAKGFVSSPRFVARVVNAWLRGDIALLVGQPGTGKTFFSNLVAECLEAELGTVTVTKIPVRADFDEGDLIGYEQLDGSARLREFAATVLQTDDPLGTHLVILDEFNLASVESYLAAVLIAMEDHERRVMLPGGKTAYLPVDSFILATCNSYLDEPESRLRVSYPTKRRAAVIEMPNVLVEEYERLGARALVEHAVRQIKAEADLVSARIGAGRGTAADAARLAALSRVSDESALSTKVRDALSGIGKSIIETPEGRTWFTLGLLKDVALTIAMAPRDEGEELIALGEAVADKLVPQLRGPIERADALLAATGGLPNRALVEAALGRMRTGFGDQLQPSV
jgi:MoxR-like ATPase